jgi:hypothetical protein
MTEKKQKKNNIKNINILIIGIIIGQYFVFADYINLNTLDILTKIRIIILIIFFIVYNIMNAESCKKYKKENKKNIIKNIFDDEILVNLIFTIIYMVLLKLYSLITQTEYLVNILISVSTMLIVSFIGLKNQKNRVLFKHSICIAIMMTELTIMYYVQVYVLIIISSLK